MEITNDCVKNNSLLFDIDGECINPFTSMTGSCCDELTDQYDTIISLIRKNPCNTLCDRCRKYPCHCHGHPHPIKVVYRDRYIEVRTIRYVATRDPIIFNKQFDVLRIDSGYTHPQQGWSTFDTEWLVKKGLYGRIYFKFKNDIRKGFTGTGKNIWLKGFNKEFIKNVDNRLDEIYPIDAYKKTEHYERKVKESVKVKALYKKNHSPDAIRAAEKHRLDQLEKIQWSKDNPDLTLTVAQHNKIVLEKEREIKQQKLRDRLSRKNTIIRKNSMVKIIY